MYKSNMYFKLVMLFKFKISCLTVANMMPANLFLIGTGNVPSLKATIHSIKDL